ncbi:hypothetical protein D3C73_671160 [compost metagenome]
MSLSIFLSRRNLVNTMSVISLRECDGKTRPSPVSDLSSCFSRISIALWAERNAMQDLALYAGGGNGPDGVGEIDLVPLHMAQLARAASGEDQKFQHQPRNGLSLLQH